MLISRLVEIDGLIDSCEIEEKLGRAEKILNNVYRVAEEYNANLNKFREIVETLSRFQTDGELYEEMSGILKEHFDKMKAEVTERLRNDDYTFADMLQGLSHQLDNLVREADERWRQRISDMTGQNMVILKILSGMLNSYEINKVLESMERLRVSKPSAENYQKMLDLQESTERIISRLELNGNIIDFLKKVYRKEAVLSDLTQEIIDWCKNNKIDGKLKVSF